jgi:hypothetical protein
LVLDLLVIGIQCRGLTREVVGCTVGRE